MRVTEWLGLAWPACSVPSRHPSPTSPAHHTPSAAAAQAPPPKLRPLVAEQLMATPAVGLPRIVPAAQAESLLRYSRHHGFPVYDPLHVDAQVCVGGWVGLGAGAAAACGLLTGNTRRRHAHRRAALLAAPQTGAFRVDGLVMRSQIELLLQHRVYCDRHGRYLQPPPPGLDTAAWERRLAAAMTGTLQHAVSIGALRTLRSGGATSSDLLAPHAGGSGHEAFSARPSPFDNQVRGGAGEAPCRQLPMPAAATASPPAA